jgi:HEAT repeat protein
VDALIDALSDRGTGVRDNVVWSLGQIGPQAKSAVPDLVHILQNKTESPSTKANIVQALALIGRPYGMEAARRYLRAHPEVDVPPKIRLKLLE